MCSTFLADWDQTQDCEQSSLYLRSLRVSGSISTVDTLLWDTSRKRTLSSMGHKLNYCPSKPSIHTNLFICHLYERDASIGRGGGAPLLIPRMSPWWKFHCKCILRMQINDENDEGFSSSRATEHLEKGTKFFAGYVVPVAMSTFTNTKGFF